MLDELDAKATGARLTSFESEVKKVEAVVKNPLRETKVETDRAAQRYFLAVSRQTDNIIPRQTRIDIVAELIS